MSQKDVPGGDEGLQESSRGGAGRLADFCGDGDRGKFDGVNGRNSQFIQVINVAPMLDSTSGNDEKNISMLSLNSDDKQTNSSQSM